MTPQLFQITTVEGSTFLVSFLPKLEDAGIWYGLLHVVGDSLRYGHHMNVRAKGAMPEVGGEIRVSNNVIEQFQMGDGTEVKVYETETISEVVELEFPSSPP